MAASHVSARDRLVPVLLCMRMALPGCMPNRLVIEPTSRRRRNRRHRSFSCCLRGSLSMRLTSLGPRRLRPRSPPAAAAAFLSPCRHVLRFSHPSHRAPSPPPPCAKPAVAAIHIGGAATAPSSAFASELCFLSHPLSILLRGYDSNGRTPDGGRHSRRQRQGSGSDDPRRPGTRS